jgi:uncharacterized membrane protein YccC
MNEARARDLAFVLRCSGAATLSFVLAGAVALPHPVWAAMSGIIVGQEKLGDTRQANIGRFFCTLLGVAIAVAVGILGGWLGANIVTEMAIAVALAAVVARRHPSLRVCMWTCPIVFLTVTPGTPLWEAGLFRGAEVLLGGSIGAVLHLLAELVIERTYHKSKA